jgi:hypothetical protein
LSGCSKLPQECWSSTESSGLTRSRSPDKTTACILIVSKVQIWQGGRGRWPRERLAGRCLQLRCGLDGGQDKTQKAVIRTTDPSSHGRTCDRLLCSGVSHG